VLFPSFASRQNAYFIFSGDSTPHGLRYGVGKLGDNWQQQINLTDNISRVSGVHQLKFGVDYRRITSKAGPYGYNIAAAFSTLANVLTNTLPAASVVSRNDDVQLVFTSVSLFAQDTWKPARTQLLVRLTGLFHLPLPR
jgi:outer membrane receptor protein involved in Fe transport